MYHDMDGNHHGTKFSIPMPVILGMLHIPALEFQYSVFAQEETSLMQNSVYSIKGDAEFCNVGNTSSIPQ